MWELPSGKRNEALDTACYALAARHATRIPILLPRTEPKPSAPPVVIDDDSVPSIAEEEPETGPEMGAPSPPRPQPRDITRLELTGSTDSDFQIIVEGRGAAARLTKTGTWKPNLDTDLNYVPSRRPWTDRFHTQPSGLTVKKTHETGVYNSLKQQEFYVDSQFGSSIAPIEINPDAKRSYTALLSKLEPTITDWTIDNREMDFISFTSVSGVAHRCGLVGEGVANIFRLAFALYDFKPNEVLLLDEPELSLHPQAQKRLYEELRQSS
jgi:hypothetical protein